MTSLISLGAINKITREYVYPKIANKKDEYVCPDCNRDLILCQGDIRVHHFRHKVDTVTHCQHYNSPTESQIHKDAKMLLKTLLEKKIPLSFIRNCSCCKKNEEYVIPEVTETTTIELEHRFEYNGLKIADVAYINNNKLLYIFEIYNTHKTNSENRPEPWFEINALELIKMVNDGVDNQVKINCIRCEKCDNCIEKDCPVELFGGVFKFGNMVEGNTVCDICKTHKIKQGDKIGWCRYNSFFYCKKCYIDISKYVFITKPISLFQSSFPEKTEIIEIDCNSSDNYFAKKLSDILVICVNNFNETEKRIISEYNINNIEELIRNNNVIKTDKQRCLKAYKYVRDRYDITGIEPLNGHTSLYIEKYMVNIRILPDGNIKYCNSFGEKNRDDFTFITYS